jgi:hypothetical protein
MAGRVKSGKTGSRANVDIGARALEELREIEVRRRLGQGQLKRAVQNLGHKPGWRVTEER